MSWTVIALIAFILVIAVGVTVKLILRRKLNDIDGFGGKAIQKNEDDHIIGL